MFKYKFTTLCLLFVLTVLSVFEVFGQDLENRDKKIQESIKILEDKNSDKITCLRALVVIQRYRGLAKDAVPDLIKFLDSIKDRNLSYEDKQVLKSQTLALIDGIGNLEKVGRDEIQILAAFTYDSYDLIYGPALSALSKVGPEAKRLIPSLLEDLPDEAELKDLPNETAQKHRTKVIHTGNTINAIAESLIFVEDTSANEDLIKAYNTLVKIPLSGDGIRFNQYWKKDLKVNIETLESIKRKKFWENVKGYVGNNAVIVWTFAVFIGLLSLWAILLWLRPIWLLSIYKFLPFTAETKLSGWLATLTVPLQAIISFCVFRPRVLDAWVAKNVEEAGKKFSEKQTVKDRKIYVPVGLFLNDNLIEFTPEELRETFTRNQSRVLITGEGGSGKTSLACQIAKWAMSEDEEVRLFQKHSAIPILLEQDFVVDTLQNAVSDQLTNQIDAEERVSDVLLRELLKRKRILVLVDGMSEMNEKTTTAIQKGITDIPVNVVIFTSRGDSESEVIIKPTKIKGNQLSSFVERYLSSLGKRNLFEDEIFFEGCRRLSVIVGDRDITVLLAKLFVEQMIAKQEKDINENLPKNVPELMSQSIKLLHIKTPSAGLKFTDIAKAAKIIAWECLKNDYRPIPADNERVLQSLADLSNGEKSFEHLKDKLKQIETIGVEDKIRFKIDPLAEYFAGMYLTEINGSNNKKWKDFINDALSKEGSPDNIKGFLLAVRDCCLTNEKTPKFVAGKISEMFAVTKQNDAQENSTKDVSS